MTGKRGLLLLNLGTPDAPRPPELRRYLRQFLSDPRVLDIPAFGRWALLNLVILPRRPRRSAAAYAKVWTARGSPFRAFSEDFHQALERAMPATPIAFGMRYGRPDIESAFRELRDAGCDRIVVFPLYPHYASSSTGTALQQMYRLAGESWNVPFLDVVPPFFDKAVFLDAFAEVGRRTLTTFDADHLLFSYHGLPERQVRKSEDREGRCRFDADCCASLDADNRNCYRAQCYATTRGILARLDHSATASSTSFQSRLGRTPWIRPFTDQILPELAKKGVRRVAVFSPSFVTDCLETLEELAIRAREDFVAAGGEDLRLVPSLNAESIWVQGCAELLKGHGLKPEFEADSDGLR